MPGLSCRLLPPSLNYEYGECIVNVVLFIVVKRRQTLLSKKPIEVEAVISYPSCTENRQDGVLNASSTPWYPSPITTRPTKPFLSTLSRAVRFWYGMHCNIEGRSVCALNLISQHSALPLPEEPFDWCPFEKQALGLTGGVQRVGEIRAATAQPEKGAFWSTTPDCSYNGFQLTKGKDWELIWASTGEPVMQYSCIQTNESPD